MMMSPGGSLPSSSSREAMHAHYWKRARERESHVGGCILFYLSYRYTHIHVTIDGMCRSKTLIDGVGYISMRPSHDATMLRHHWP